MRPTGVDIVDRVVGGMAPGLPLVLAGPSGSGRTVLALQLVRAALDNAQVVTYLCHDPAPLLVRQADTLGLPLTPELETGQLVLLELEAEAAALARAHGLAALIEAARAEEPLASTLIVDPFTALTPELHDEAALRAQARACLRAASPMQIVWTAEAEQLELQRGLDRVLGEVCGSFLALERQPDGTRRVRVEKTRGGVAGEEQLAFEIVHGGARVREVEARDAAAPPSLAPPVDETPTARAALQTDTAPELRARRVIVVDPDRASRERATKWLSADYEVSCARDGFEAMTLLLTERPDLVILDLLMPRISGFELLAALQRSALEVPVLVVSGRLERPADRIAPLVLGATDLLAKPVERFELLHKVDTLLRLGGPARKLLDPADAEALFAAPSASRQLEADAFRERLERAWRFGERCGATPSLICLETPSGVAMDRLVEVAEGELRFEDAVLRVSRRRALLLLVATEPADSSLVVARLLERLAAEGGPAERVRTRVEPARPVPADVDWQRLFRGEESE